MTRVRFESLPTEIILHIISFLNTQHSIAALARTNHLLYAICDPYLYRYNVVHGNGSALSWAAERGVSSTFHKALDAGAPLSMDQPRGKRVYHGDVPIMRFGHLSRPCSKDFPPHPLSLAIKGGHMEIAEVILERGASVNMTDPGRFSLLSLAAIHGHTSIVRRLLHRGARQDFISLTGHTALSLAAFQGHREIVEILLWDIEERPIHFRDGVLHGAVKSAISGSNEPILQLMIERGFNLRSVYHGQTPLQFAAMNGEPRIVRFLLENGADPNFVHDAQSDDAALTKAVLKNNREIVELLIPGTEDLHRTRALSFAVSFGNKDLVTLLLENGVQPDLCESSWVQPLAMAVEKRDLDMVKLLLDAGAEVNIYCGAWPFRATGRMLYYSVLFAAVHAQDEAMVNLLLERGANVNITDWYRRTALEYATGLRNEAIVQSLRRHAEIHPEQSGQETGPNWPKIHYLAGPGSFLEEITPLFEGFNYEDYRRKRRMASHSIS